VSEDGVRAMLRRDRETFAAALDRVGGKREWALKGFAYPDRLSQWLRATHADLADSEQPEGSGGEGSAYLARKQLDRRVEEEAERALAGIARECHEQLAVSAVETRLEHTAATTARRDRGKLFFNGIYLVERSREKEWHEAVRQLAQRFAEQGVSLEPTGPWPAYNFVREEGD
jgi:Gas vesicle synthesis protein GvpL/GvpF